MEGRRRRLQRSWAGPPEANGTFRGRNRQSVRSIFGRLRPQTHCDYALAGDRIHLENAIFTRLVTGNLSAQAFTANATGTAQDATDRIVYNTTTGQLSYDADGSGAGAARAFAILTTKPAALNAGDFLVV